MATYMTKQRKDLLLYLSEHADEVLSAKQIAEALSGEEISVSAVYRNLSALEETGKVKRVSRAGSREVFFRYVASPACRGCLHLSCKRCGKTFHMDAKDADELISRLAIKEQFLVDRAETVVYGVCGTCQRMGARGTRK